MTSLHSGQAVIDALHARGVIANAESPPFMEVEHRPWFVSLMMGVAGWLAGLFLLSFIGITVKPDSQVTIFSIGAVLLGSAWFLYKADREAVFLDQLALALSIAGQMAVAWAFLENVDSALVISAALLAIQLAVLWLMPNHTARTIAALFATIAWVYTVRFALQGGDEDDLFFARGMLRESGGKLAAGWLLTWLPLLLLVTRLVGRESEWMSQPRRMILRPVLTGALLGLSIGGLATEPLSAMLLGSDSLGVDFSWMALFPLLSIALSLFAAYYAFQLGSWSLVGFASFGALLHLSRFYYFYGTTLTWKALIMVCVGAILVAASLLLKARASAEAAP